jgi:hypothetical protein
MTPEQFAYWLQGFAELQKKPPTVAQWQTIQDHLHTVFHKVTPPIIGQPQPGISLGPNLDQWPWSGQRQIITC